jgi:RNA polymerase sigma factor (sigma-70 family)
MPDAVRQPDPDLDLIEAYLVAEPEAVARVDRWIAAAASPFRSGLQNDWEDALQEVRLETFRLLQSGRFRGASSLKTYLWQVTAHSCIDLLRRRRRRPVEDIEDVPEPVSGAPSPLDRVNSTERPRRVLGVLGSMSSECRELWTLVLQGLSYRDIGERLGVAEGALRVRAHRCRKRATDALASNETAARDASDSGEPR